MLLAPETVGVSLQGVVGFSPNQSNDWQRVDLSREGGAFIAIDPPGATEIDDAVRIARLGRDLWLLEVAIAECGQISQDDMLVDGALRAKHNTYDESNRRIMPQPVVDRLQLNSGSGVRALVVELYLNADSEPVDYPRITPALIAVQHFTYTDFAQYLPWATTGTNAKGLEDFYRRFATRNGITIDPAEELGYYNQLSEYARGIVHACMVMANMAVADWAADKSVEVLHRNFDLQSKPDTIDGTEDDDFDPHRAGYSVDSLPHHGIAGFRKGISYTHTTSPLRRAADLVNHLIISAILEGRDSPFSREYLTVIAKHLSTDARTD